MFDGGFKEGYEPVTPGKQGVSLYVYETGFLLCFFGRM